MIDCLGHVKHTATMSTTLMMMTKTAHCMTFHKIDASCFDQWRRDEGASGQLRHPKFGLFENFLPKFGTEKPTTPLTLTPGSTTRFGSMQTYRNLRLQFSASKSIGNFVGGGLCRQVVDGGCRSGSMEQQQQQLVFAYRQSTGKRPIGHASILQYTEWTASLND